MTAKLRDLFIGKPLSDDQLSGEKFRVLWGLPIYSSDTISSVAYAGEEVLVVLLPVLGLMATHTLVYVMCAIIALLLILVFCYRQTIDAYPQGGGAYIVGADNLGEIPGLVAASSLTVGYILTVAVSSCSGAAAVVSAFPALGAYKAWIAFAIVCLLTWGNLRGMRESAVMFGVPTYFFILSILVLIITGFVRAELGYEPPAPAAVAETAGDVTLFLLLRAFASGCTALTGVEAVSNGVPSFHEPSAKNAKLVLSLMAGIVGVTFISVAVLTDIYHVVPENGMTAIACLAAAVFGSGSVWFHIFQIATVVILSLAANTAYAGMPLLLAMVAHDGYMPRRYTQRGARLNFSNGVLLIFFSASALIFLFNADTHTLLPLYATGVFVSFTISQAGMFVRWTKTRPAGWKHRAVINALGTVICAVVCLVIAVTRFTEGAWVVVIIIPAFVYTMLRIKRHYNRVADDLRISSAEEARQFLGSVKPGRVILPVQTINRSFIKTLDCALGCGFEDIELYNVSADVESAQRLQKQVEELGLGLRFVYDVTPYRNTNEVLLRHVYSEAQELEEHQSLTVMMGALVVTNPVKKLLHNQTTQRLTAKLEKYRNVNVFTVPYIV